MSRIIIIIFILFFQAGIPFLQTSALAEDSEIRIALRAQRGVEKAMTQWQATADYLTKAIPGYRFVMVPFKQNAILNQEVSQGEFHFILTNPSASVELSISYNTTPLATLVNKRQGKGYMQFGSVIFTRADRDDINTLQDLKGKIFMGADDIGFGGWRVAWQELLQNNIDPFRDFKEVRFAGGIQQTVVRSVLERKVDAGSVRTDMLERMAAKNEIKLEDFKVLGVKHKYNFPFLLSTELYPEWAFSRTGSASSELGIKVLQALLAIPADSKAAQSGKYVGWIKALDYSTVDKLLKDLAVGPYQYTSDNLWADALRQYWLFLLLMTIAVIGFTVWLVLLVKNK